MEIARFTQLENQQPDWDMLLTTWLDDVARHSPSPHTRTSYLRAMQQFRLALAEHSLDVPQATSDHIEAFLVAELPDARTHDLSIGKRPGASTQRVRLAALRSFYKFAQRKGYMITNPTDGVRGAKLPDSKPQGLTLDQVMQLLDAPSDTPAGRRDHAIMYTMVLTGLRREELLGLKAGDLSFDGPVIMYTLMAKGGKLRHRQLTQAAWNVITAYLESIGRPFDEMDEDERIFPVGSTGFYRNVKRYGQKIGLPELTIHHLRHTSAKLRLAVGETVDDIQEALGHTSRETTARYLKRLAGTRDPGAAKIAALLHEQTMV